MLEYPNNLTQIHRPVIWVVDLNTDEVIHRFVVPASVIAKGRGLISITLDTDAGCDKAFAYIPDLMYNLLHVYSLELNRIWSFEHKYFQFDPIAADLEIGGQSFRWTDGLFSISLGPKLKNGSRIIFFHAMIDDDGIMWVVTNSMPIFVYFTLDTNNFNFHVWIQDTKLAVANTICA